MSRAQGTLPRKSEKNAPKILLKYDFLRKRVEVEVEVKDKKVQETMYNAMVTDISWSVSEAGESVHATINLAKP